MYIVLLSDCWAFVHQRKETLKISTFIIPPYKKKKDGDSTDLVARTKPRMLCFFFLLCNIITAGGTGKSSEHILFLKIM